jgi:uncharacterized protein YprB with RNaseH-like and TPR domain
MLRHTFCHLPGVGEATERRLWGSGLTSWDALLDQARTRTSPVARRLPAAHLRESLERYERSDPVWFGERLPPAQQWRLFRDFRGSCAYLDIETTGMGGLDEITTIALYDGRIVRHYVRGRDLPRFLDDVAAYRLLVTYNGKSFDVPFIERCLRCRLDHAHIDLRHVLRSLGLRGGLKSCERQMGLSRPGMEDIDGCVAVLLWAEFTRRGNAAALESLLAYNVQDAVNLEKLMVLAYNLKLAELADVPFAAGYRLEVPAPAANPFRVDALTVARLLRENPLPAAAW